MNVTDMQMRLLSRLREKVRNGQVTERGFARTVGISQPHVHKVLKGTRTLSLDGLDSVLRSLSCSILDLCTETELEEHLSKVKSYGVAFANLRFLRGAAGPGQGGLGGVGDDVHAVPCHVFENPRDAILIRLSPDPEMAYASEGWDMAVLVKDSNPLPTDAVYAVDRGSDVVLRRVRRGASIVYLASDTLLQEPGRWEIHSRRVGLRVWGRVVWLGREVEPFGLGQACGTQAPKTTRS